MKYLLFLNNQPPAFPLFNAVPLLLYAKTLHSASFFKASAWESWPQLPGITMVIGGLGLM
jgi:hypothetical protein